MLGIRHKCSRGVGKSAPFGAPPAFSSVDDVRGRKPSAFRELVANAIANHGEIDLSLTPYLRVAAFSLSFAGAAHAASGNRNSDNPWTADATASAAVEMLPAKKEVRRQLVRASWYGGGERLASHTSTGELFRPMGHTAAHRTLPFGTMLRVTSAASGRSTIVRINDRGPAAATGRALDLSRGAALDLGLVATGQGAVYIEVMR